MILDFTNENTYDSSSESVDTTFYGWSVGLFDNSFIVGGRNFGKAFIFQLNETSKQWYEKDVLYCDNSTNSYNITSFSSSSIDDNCDLDTFGTSVDITLNYAIIGDYNSGVSHIFVKNNNTQHMMQ